MKGVNTMRIEAEISASWLRAYQSRDQNARVAQPDEHWHSTSQSETNSACSSLSSMSSMTSCETDPLISASTNASVRGLYTRSSTASPCDHNPALNLEKANFMGTFVSYGSISDSSGHSKGSTATGKLKEARDAAQAKAAEDLEANLAGSRSVNMAAYKRLLLWAFVKEGNKPWTNAEVLLFLLVFCLFLVAIAGAWMSLPEAGTRGVM